MCSGQEALSVLYQIYPEAGLAHSIKISLFFFFFFPVCWKAVLVQWWLQYRLEVQNKLNHSLYTAADGADSSDD